MSTVMPKTKKRKVRFAKRVARMDGGRVRYLEAGQGSPVVILDGDNGLTQSPLSTMLAQQFRVIVCDLASAEDVVPRDLAHKLTQATSVIGLDHYVLVSTSTSSSLALWQAIEAQKRLDALVLVSPSTPDDVELESRLRDIQAPTLVLVGTNDTSLPPETGRRYVEQLSNCYYVMVYDAGHAIEKERPEALATTVCDFVERRGAFIVESNSSALNP
jgi:4,5:9,10-diseco-3-hydroxy-5,9,17-trioxoandrosta-1(10),2-diene-4-oate hydrolase